MLTDLQQALAATVAVFKAEMTLYGFTFSWWEVFFWGLVAGLIIWFLKEVSH